MSKRIEVLRARLEQNLLEVTQAEKALAEAEARGDVKEIGIAVMFLTGARHACESTEEEIKRVESFLASEERQAAVARVLGEFLPAIGEAMTRVQGAAAKLDRALVLLTEGCAEVRDAVNDARQRVRGTAAVLLAKELFDDEQRRLEAQSDLQHAVLGVLPALDNAIAHGVASAVAPMGGAAFRDLRLTGPGYKPGEEADREVSRVMRYLAAQAAARLEGAVV